MVYKKEILKRSLQTFKILGEVKFADPIKSLRENFVWLECGEVYELDDKM